MVSSGSGRDPAITQRLGHVDAADRVGTGHVGDGARHPQHPGIAARRQPHGVRGLQQQLAPRLIGRGKALGGLAKGALRAQIERIDLAPLLGRMLGAMLADGRHMPVIEALIRRIALLLEANEELVRAMIHDRANTLLRWTRMDERLASAVLDALYKLLAEVVVLPDHPLRRKIEEGLEQLAHDLINDPAMHARVERMKTEALRNPAFAAWLDSLWERGRSRLLQLVRQPQGALDGQLGQPLAELGRALQHDARLRLLVNRFARRTLVGIATRYGGQIVRLVSETVRRWDARTVTDRIEGAVGRDLQFIRINGTVVGGLVGVAIHAVDVLLK